MRRSIRWRYEVQCQERVQQRTNVQGRPSCFGKLCRQEQVRRIWKKVLIRFVHDMMELGLASGSNNFSLCYEIFCCVFPIAVFRFLVWQR
jgi:hypothetical protein